MILIGSLILSSNAYLKSITTDLSTSLTPSFSSYILAYSSTVDSAVSQVAITAITEETSARICIYKGTKTSNSTTASSLSSTLLLETGLNYIFIEVVAADEVSTNTYSLTIQRQGQESLNNDASLTSLFVSGGSLQPSFSTSTFFYQISSKSGTMYIMATAKSSSATMKLLQSDSEESIVLLANQWSSSIKLSSSRTYFYIKVVAGDGVTTSSYTVVVDYAIPLSNNALLQSILISPSIASWNFTSSVTKYRFQVDSQVENIKLTATTQHSDAQISVSVVSSANFDSSDGSSLYSSHNITSSVSLLVSSTTIVTFTVMAADKTTLQHYILYIYRPEIKVITNNLYLSSLKLYSSSSQSLLYSPSFSSLTLSYSVSVANAYGKIGIMASTQDTGVSMKLSYSYGIAPLISGSVSPVSLNEGINIIRLILTSQDGTSNLTYIISVSRAPAVTASSNALLKTLQLQVEPSVTSIASFVFSPYQRQYTFQDSCMEDIQVMATAEDSAATLFASSSASTSETVAAVLSLSTTTNTMRLSSGLNTVRVQVTAADTRTTLYYDLNFYKVGECWRQNSLLSSLLPSTGSLQLPSFDSYRLNYYQKVTAGTSFINVTATAQRTEASIAIRTAISCSDTSTQGLISMTQNHQSRNMPLETGTNYLQIVVTAVDTTSTRTYCIAIEVPKVVISASNNALLASLQLTGITVSPSFQSDRYIYQATVDYERSSTNAVVTYQDMMASSLLKVGTTSFDYLSLTNTKLSPSLSLQVGNNIISIQVTAADGITTVSYIIIVQRLNQRINVDMLTVNFGSLSPSFSSDISQYIVDVGTNKNITFGIATGSQLNVQYCIGTSTTFNQIVLTTGLFTSPAIPLSIGSNNIAIRISNNDKTSPTIYNLFVIRISPNRFLSNIANLASLSLSLSSSLQPSFSSSTYTYYLTVDNSLSSVVVVASPMDSSASLKMRSNANSFNANWSTGTNNICNVPQGYSQVEIMITAADGITVRRYFVNIYRPVSSVASNNALLTSLSLSAGVSSLKPSFTPLQLKYNVSVSYSVTQITMAAVPADTNSVIELRRSGNEKWKSLAMASISDPISLLPGAVNLIFMRVTAPDGLTTRTYEISVARASAKTNAALASLILDCCSFQPSFASDVYFYTVNVGSSTNQINWMTTAAQASGATLYYSSSSDTSSSSSYANIVSGSSQSLNVGFGLTTLKIRVIAEDNISEAYYSINIFKAESSSDDAFLESLQVSSNQLQPSFSPEVLSYRLEIPNKVDAINVSMTCHPSARMFYRIGDATNSLLQQVDVSGLIMMKGLNVGITILSIRVIAGDGASMLDYTLSIVRADASVNLVIVGNFGNITRTSIVMLQSIIAENLVVNPNRISIELSNSDNTNIVLSSLLPSSPGPQSQSTSLLSPFSQNVWVASTSYSSSTIKATITIQPSSNPEESSTTSHNIGNAAALALSDPTNQLYQQIESSGITVQSAQVQQIQTDASGSSPTTSTTSTSNLESSTSSSSGIIIGAVIGVAVIIIAAGVCIVKRKKRSSDSKGTETQEGNTTDILKKSGSRYQPSVVEKPKSEVLNTHPSPMSTDKGTNTNNPSTDTAETSSSTQVYQQGTEGRMITNNLPSGAKGGESIPDNEIDPDFMLSATIHLPQDDWTS